MPNRHIEVYLLLASSQDTCTLVHPVLKYADSSRLAYCMYNDNEPEYVRISILTICRHH